MAILLHNNSPTKIPVFTHEVALAIDAESKEQIMKVGPRKLRALFMACCPEPETTILFKGKANKGYEEIQASARANDADTLKRNPPLLISASLYDTNKALEIAQQWAHILDQHVPRADFQVIVSDWETHLLTKEAPATNGWGKHTWVTSYLKDIQGIYVEEETAWLTSNNKFRVVVQGKGLHADKICKDFSNWWVKKKNGLVESSYVRANNYTVIYTPEIHRPNRMAKAAALLSAIAGEQRATPKQNRRV